MKAFLSYACQLEVDFCILGQWFLPIILLHEKFLQFDWLITVVFRLNLKFPQMKITNLLRVVV